MKVIEDKVDGDDFYIVVSVDVFSKLVAKTTVETITLTLKETVLEVKGNGTYSIELPLDENGQLIKYSEYKFDSKVEGSVVNLSTIRTLMGINKSALAVTTEQFALTGYYCDNKRVISTDTFKVCNTDIPLFETPVLVPSELMDLVSLMTEEKITVQISGSKMLFTTNNMLVYGIQLDGINDYPVTAVDSFLHTEFPIKCTLLKNALLDVLDRLMLFVTDYDKNGIYLTFSKEGLMLSSKKETGIELIAYQNSTNFRPFTCCASIRLLHSLVTAQTEDTFDLWYGHEQAIKMTFGKITQIMALFEDSRVETDGTTSS